MAKQTALYLSKNFAAAGATLTSADTTAWKTIYTAAADDATIKALACTSNDTAAVNLRLGIDISGTVYQIGCVNVPIAAGTNGTAPAVDLLSPAALPFLAVDRNGKRVLSLKAGTVLKVAALATMTAAKTLTVVALPEEF